MGTSANITPAKILAQPHLRALFIIKDKKPVLNKYHRPSFYKGYSAIMDDLVQQHQKLLSRCTLVLSELTQAEREALYTRPSEEPMSQAEAYRLKNPNSKQPTYNELCKATFAAAFALDKLTLEETTHERIQAGWRIFREMARNKRYLSPDEAIITARPGSEDLSNTAYLTTPEATAHMPYLALCADALQRLPPNAQGPLPLFPPPVPPNFIDPDTHAIKQAYDPNDNHKDPMLHLYIGAIQTIAHSLGLYDTFLGRKGMRGLVSTTLVRICFPSRMQLISWEYILITETLNKMLKHGQKVAHDYLHEHYGLNHIEVYGLMKMAKGFAKSLCDTEREEARALMLLRCENYMSRAHKALDLKGELGAIKQMSQILGLTRTEEDENFGDFISVVQQHTAKQVNIAKKDLPLPPPQI